MATHFLCLCPSPSQCVGLWLTPCLYTYLPFPNTDGLCGAIPTPAPQVFGIILVSVFAYDAFKIYRTEMAPRATQGECLCSGRGDAFPAAAPAAPA